MTWAFLPFEVDGHTFTDIRLLQPSQQEQVKGMLAAEARRYPPQLYCQGGVGHASEVLRLQEDLGMTGPQAEAYLVELEACRHPIQEFWGDMPPITFGIQEGFAGRLVAAWTMWAIRELDGSTEQDLVVRVRPFPAYPGGDVERLVQATLDLMVWSLGQVFNRTDGGTFRIQEWASHHYRAEGNHGDELLAAFEVAYQIRGALPGMSLVVEADPLMAGRQLWVLGPV